LRLLNTLFPPEFPDLNATDIAKQCDDLCPRAGGQASGSGARPSAFYDTCFQKRNAERFLVARNVTLAVEDGKQAVCFGAFCRSTSWWARSS